IVERAEGIPLYVEEITKATLEGRDDRNADQRIPATLRDSLTGRLDRLGWVKEVAQAAAVIGREFDDELLSSIIGLPDERGTAARWRGSARQDERPRRRSCRSSPRSVPRSWRHEAGTRRRSRTSTRVPVSWPHRRAGPRMSSPWCGVDGSLRTPAARPRSRA